MMKALWQYPVYGFPTLSSHFAFVLPCVPLLSLQAMIAVGTHPVALRVMLVVLSFSCHGIVDRLCLLGKGLLYVTCVHASLSGPAAGRDGHGIRAAHRRDGRAEPCARRTGCAGPISIL